MPNQIKCRIRQPGHERRKINRAKAIDTIKEILGAEDEYGVIEFEFGIMSVKALELIVKEG